MVTGICAKMKKVMLRVDDYLYEFYKRVGESSGGLQPEQVMADALFKFAGELSVKVVRQNEKNTPRKKPL